MARQQREAGRLAERSRIARDLHDTLAQELAGSRMLLQAAERDWDRSPDAAPRQLRTVTDALGEHLAQTRGIIDDLTPPLLAQDGLAAALRDLCARADPTAGSPRISFRTEHEPYPLPTDRAVALLRVAQGLLANAREHARATHVHHPGLRRRGGCRRGPGRRSGLRPGHREGGPRRPRIGLAAARDRLRAFGGTLTVDSAPGRGTRVRAALPAEDRVPAGAR
ncbi:sensor histidine kinase [Streptomyces sp. NPDC058676]|uniref:sensor histidine kinase n=1 Tax=unclassified Streptomyces TaxID=2593676 RepID=UPI00365D4838